MKNELRRQTKIFDDKDDRRKATEHLIAILMIIIGIILICLLAFI